jgi:predicted membrane-bound spermidine synthase
MRGLLWFCFAFSGAAALALEMLWIRSAGLALGTTVLTTATVLACYFAGLGLGAVCRVEKRGHSDFLRSKESGLCRIN